MIWKMISEADTFEHAANLNKDRLDTINSLIDSQAQIMTNSTFIMASFNSIRKVHIIITLGYRKCSILNKSLPRDIF